MTEEELVIFDILTRPAPELSPEERAEVKQVARTLLERLKALLVLNWRQKSAARPSSGSPSKTPRREPAARLYPGDLRAEMLRRLHALLRELPGERFGGLRHGCLIAAPRIPTPSWCHLHHRLSNDFFTKSSVFG